MGIQNVEIILGILAFIITGYLALLVFLNNPKSWTSRFFLLLGIVINAYIVTNYFSLHPPISSPDEQLFWIRVVMLVTSFLGPVLLFLVSVFPREDFTMKKRYLIAILFLMIASAGISFTPLMFSGISYPDGQINPIPGVGFPLFIVDFAGLFFVSFIVFLLKFRRSKGVERNQYRYFFYGILLTFTLMVITNVIFVILLKKSYLVFLGPIYPVILMGAIAYSIVKYKLFNIKVIATQAFVTIISILFFARIFASQSYGDRLVDIIIFVATALFGILLIRSIKEEVRSREEIRLLAQRLAETNFTIAKTNEQLRVIDQRKSEFISIVSHQLRTPITAIKGYSSLILENSYGEFPPAMKVPLERIFLSSSRLADMVTEFLDISKIEQGTMKYDLIPVDIGLLLDDLSDDFTQMVEDKNLEFHVHIPTGDKFIAIADEGKIRQIFSNMIDNSIKYTIKGEINIFLERDDARSIIMVKIKDTGIGLSQDDIHHLFGKFTRGAGGQGQNTEGSGLGLYVAKKMLESQNGNVWVDSDGPGKGSTFIIELPAIKNI